MSDIPDRIDGQIDALRHDLDDLVRFAERIEIDLQRGAKGPPVRRRRGSLVPAG